MKLSKKLLIILLIGSLSVLSLSCAAKSDSTVSENQIVTVQRGDLKTDIIGVGNLALSDKEDLAFEMLGTVEEVLVEEGDSVEKGQVLAKLDTSAWEDNIATLEDKVIAAERNVTAKERAVTTAKRQITAKELAHLKAQVNLQTAENNLNKVAEVKKVTDTIDAAEYAFKFAKSMLAGEFGGGLVLMDYNYWSQLKALAEEQLAEARRNLQEILAGTSIKVTSDVLLEVAMKKLEMEQAQWGLEDAQVAIEDAKAAVGDAEKAVEDAQKALKDAQKALDEAKELSPTITAPFAGFITKVNVKGGDEVKKGTVAVVIADPNKFEAEVMVSEADVLKVKLDGDASVQVEAMPGVSLPAQITHISPSATIQSGVVNYKVKVELQSLEAIMQARQQAGQGVSSNISSVAPSQSGQGASGNLSSGNITSRAPSQRFGQAFGSGNLTQEQINQMMQQRQSAQAGQPSGQQQQIPTMTPEDFQLREGLTVTVSIIVAERSNVLLVPLQAIISRGSQTLVQVLKDGVTEERSVIVGISNWQYAEVTNGLSEGEQVIVPRATATTSTTSQQTQPSGGRMFTPGMGGFGR